MEASNPPLPPERAARLIRANRYLTLATADDQGPWAAPINYVTGPGDFLHFYSTITARHSLAVSHTPRVAGAIFDTRAASEDVDGLQVAASCTVVDAGQLDEVHSHYFEVNFADPTERKWWYRPPAAFLDGGVWRFYRLTIEEAYVIDFESIEKDRVDRRVTVDLEELWRLVTSPPPGSP